MLRLDSSLTHVEVNYIHVSNIKTKNVQTLLRLLESLAKHESEAANEWDTLVLFVAVPSKTACQYLRGSTCSDRDYSTAQTSHILL